MRQQDRFRQAAERAHKRAYDTDEYTVELFNYSGGSYDPDEGQISGESRASIGTVQAEIVPPEIDATVRIEGTSFSFDTSIRFPQSTDSLTVASGESKTIPAGETQQYATVTVDGTLTVNGSLIVYDSITVNGTLDNNGTVTTFGTDDFPDTLRPLGEDNERPTEVEITDEVDNSTEVFELQGYSPEKATNMVLCRLVEQ